MGGIAAAVLLGIAAGAATSDSTRAMARQEKFLYLLRSYPQRPPRDTLGQVEQLVQQGDFPDHDRAEAWLGSAWLALQERQAARRWFERVARDHPGSVWVERSWLGLGDAAAQERRYGIALVWYAKARTAPDAAVREMGRVSEQSTLTLRERQRWACSGSCAD